MACVCLKSCSLRFFNPAFFIIHGADDIAIAPYQSVNFNEDLIATGVTSELTIVEGFGHDAGLAIELQDEILEFFSNNLLSSGS